MPNRSAGHALAGLAGAALLLGVSTVTSAGPASPALLEGSGWRLEQVQSDGGLIDAIGGHPAPVLRFSSGRLTGSTGCNRLVGSYTADGDRLQVKPDMATTMMACPEPLMTQERAVADALGRAAEFSVDGNRLTIRDAGGQPLLVLSARADQPLTGTSWRLMAYNNGRQAVVSALPDSTFMLQLRDDGQFAGKACNNYRGGYERDGDELRLVGPIAATRMACAQPEGVMEQEAAYFAALERVARFHIEGGELILSDADGATLARFRSAGDGG
jgi:heat shock protein HslJ